MQVSIRITYPAPEEIHIGLVAFEFGAVKDPHELLQDETKIRTWELTHSNMGQIDRELGVALMDPHRGLLGKRGYVWAERDQLTGLESGTGRPTPWTEAQIMSPSTLLWLAKRVPRAYFRAPAPVSLTPGNALHDAVQQTVLLQAAFRALSLNKDFKSRKVGTPPPV